MPDNSLLINNLPTRHNQDTQCNYFGNKLLTLCKESGLCILNGRKEEGKCTFHSIFRSKPVASTIDYVICDYNCYESVTNLHVLDLTEFSDHCPIYFDMKCKYIVNNSYVNKVFIL